MKKIVKLQGSKKRKPVLSRIARSVLCNDSEWSEVQALAFQRGILNPESVWWSDIVAFNEAADRFDGTVGEFLQLCEMRPELMLGRSR